MITVLSDRKKKILQLIIEDYIETAEPVGSRSIARKYNLGISPATIRNEMSDLELLGYLEQPHTSAGRPVGGCLSVLCGFHCQARCPGAQ